MRPWTGVCDSPEALSQDGQMRCVPRREEALHTPVRAQDETKEVDVHRDELEIDVVSVVSGYMTSEFSGIEEEKWVKCDEEDLVLQEVKKYLRWGWPDRKRVSAEIAPFQKVMDELEVEN
ncbi:hypothetical protein NDU88_000830 [Pleurodeles waltl]|uniref:Uncharacterized protein n=1 Tax=Pleurodeles waltl TaxID=8319 RepID=A0AAV7VA22_PLEWA|nr:hypothetical protein NDU88_000830 [Pleurodeles waltl]